MSTRTISYLPNDFQKYIRETLGLNVLLTKSTGSTNDDLKALAKSGAENGTVLIAEMQSKGHGQYQRIFESPNGGIYLSILIRTGLPSEETLRLTTLTGLKMQEAVEKVCRVKADIKAPNDLLLSGKKICGILTESYTDADSMTIIIGIGINANTDCTAFPSELSETASSIKEETGKTVDMAALTEEILKQIISIPLIKNALSSL